VPQKKKSTADKIIDGVTYTVKHKVVEDLTLQKLVKENEDVK
jgi:hypothetical protein